MKEQLSPTHKEAFQKQMSRREFLRVLSILMAGGAVSAVTAHRWRYEIRQWLKDLLVNFPGLYNKAALFEEYGLALLGMPVRVSLHTFSEFAESDIRTPTPEEVKNVKNAQEAVELFYRYPRPQLEQSSFTDTKSGIEFLMFHLPDFISDNSHVRAVLGIGLPTPAGESLLSRAIGMRVVVPTDVRGVIAPAVPIPNRAILNPATGRYKDGDYQKLKLPRLLFSQTVISTGHPGEDVQIVPNAERMIIKGIDVQGDSFHKDEIANGTVYLWSNGRQWGLAEWPDEILKARATSCARMIWNLNPYHPGKRKRVFTPYTDNFFAEQSAQQHGYLNHQVTNAPYEKIGPTAVFRTDLDTSTSDIIFIPPFLPLVVPYILRDILVETPVNGNGDKISPNSLIIAMPDAKYNTMLGFNPAILEQADGRKVFDTGEKALETGPSSDFFTMNNSLAFYLGRD